MGDVFQQSRSAAGQTSAASRHLKALGFTVLPSGAPTSREGIRVTGSAMSGVKVHVDLPTRDPLRTAQEIARALTAAGEYEVRPSEAVPTILYLSRKDG